MTAVDEAVREVAAGDVTLSRTRVPACALDPDAAGTVRELPSPAVPFTQRVRQAGEVASILGAMANKPGTVLHAQPPTFWQAWDRHRECAGHFGAPLLRWARIMWGCFHLVVILPPLYLLSWVTESPLRLLIATALIAAIWFFS